MPETMQALQILEPGKAAWKEFPVPEPGPDEALVKVLLVNTCPHWDLHIMGGEPMFPGGKLDYPYTPGQPGHEATGEVVAVGEGVDDLQPGDRVAAWMDHAKTRTGSYAQFAIYPAKDLIPVPADLPPEKVASVELAMCLQVTMDQLADINGIEGQRVGVSGLGPAGLIAVQMAKAYGAREVVGIDPVEERLALARQLGADETLSPLTDALPKGRNSDMSLDTAIDASGLKVSIEYLLDRTSRAVTVFGVLREVIEIDRTRLKNMMLVGYGKFSRQAAEKALQLIIDGKLDLAALVSHRLPFTAYHEGVDLLRQKKAIKIAFDPWME